MPTRHGLYRKWPKNSAPGHRLTAEERGVFRCGITNVFDAMTRGGFLPNLTDRFRARQVGYHLNHLCQRFVFSLQRLNGLMQEMSRLYGQLRNERLASSTFSLVPLQFEAGCYADHALSYLGAIVDDVAIGITLATGYFGPDPEEPIDSMGRLIKPAKKRAELAPVATLFSELEESGSWWKLAFERQEGGRQLLVHNQHLVNFQASGSPFKANAHVISLKKKPSVPFPDFFGLLRDILTKLFNWLDRLESVLMAHLKPKDPAWSPWNSDCPSFGVPVGSPLGEMNFEPAYFPIPLCDGSDDLWSIRLSLESQGDFMEEEIAYGAYCIYEEEKRKGRENRSEVNWFKAKDRLALIHAGLPFAE